MLQMFTSHLVLASIHAPDHIPGAGAHDMLLTQPDFVDSAKSVSNTVVPPMMHAERSPVLASRVAIMALLDTDIARVQDLSHGQQHQNQRPVLPLAESQGRHRTLPFQIMLS